MASTDPSGAEAERGQRAAQSLSELIRYLTVSTRRAEDRDDAQFEAQIAAMERLYPRIHLELSCERINSTGLLFRWQGRAANAGLAPVVLLAHLDVVPVDPNIQRTYPAFDGVQADGFLWGRGALDDKGAAVVLLEAVESLLAEGFQPERDVYLSFGSDEETGGLDAQAVVELFQERQIHPWLVLDEGGAVAEQVFPGVTEPISLVGVAEKGSLNVTVTATEAGGHSSMPPALTATARLARAVSRISRNPFKPSLHPASVELLETFAARMDGAQAQLLRRASKLRWPLARILPFFGPEANAMVRTTAAVTELSGSTAANVLAETATATVNLRIAPGETTSSALQRLRSAAKDPQLKFEVFEANEPSPTSATDNAQFGLISAAIKEAFAGVAVAPYIVMALTDSRRFNQICSAVYRFAPLRMSAAQRASLHATDERVSLTTLGEGVSFYRGLLTRLLASD